FFCGGPQNYDHEDRGSYEFCCERGSSAILAKKAGPPAVLPHAGRCVEGSAEPSVQDWQQTSSTGNGSDKLGDDIAGNMVRLESSCCPKRRGHRRIDVATGYRTDRIDQGRERKSERERDRQCSRH